MQLFWAGAVSYRPKLHLPGDYKDAYFAAATTVCQDIANASEPGMITLSFLRAWPVLAHLDTPEYVKKTFFAIQSPDSPFAAVMKRPTDNMCSFLDLCTIEDGTLLKTLFVN